MRISVVLLMTVTLCTLPGCVGAAQHVDRGNAEGGLLAPGASIRSASCDDPGLETTGHDLTTAKALLPPSGAIPSDLAQRIATDSAQLIADLQDCSKRNLNIASHMQDPDALQASMTAGGTQTAALYDGVLALLRSASTADATRACKLKDIVDQWLHVMSTGEDTFGNTTTIGIVREMNYQLQSAFSARCQADGTARDAAQVESLPVVFSREDLAFYSTLNSAGITAWKLTKALTSGDLSSVQTLLAPDVMLTIGNTAEIVPAEYLKSATPAQIAAQLGPLGKVYQFVPDTGCDGGHHPYPDLRLTPACYSVQYTSSSCHLAFVGETVMFNDQQRVQRFNLDWVDTRQC